MIHAIVTYNKIDLNRIKYLRDLERALTLGFRIAIAEWLRAVLKEIPVFTGTAKGTFAPLARIVNRYIPDKVKCDFVPNNTWKKVFKHSGTSYALGFNQGANYSKFLLNIGVTSLPGGVGGDRSFNFMFDEQLPYVLWNDLSPGPAYLTHPTPWNAFYAGRDAFNIHISRIRSSIPQLHNYLTSVVLRTNSSGTII